MKINALPFRPSTFEPLIAISVGAALALACATPMALAATMQSDLPATQHEGNISYLSGGVGESEAAAIQRVAASYPLELEFLQKEPNGHASYLAGDHVVIRNHIGKIVLQTNSEGPYLLARLPAGRYTIIATNNGVNEEHPVRVVAKKHELVAFSW